MPSQIQSSATPKRQARLTLSYIPLALIAVAFTMLISQLVMLVQTSNRMARSHQVLSHVRLIEKSAVTVETNLRGFQLTGDQEFLERFHKIVAQISRSIARLENAAPEPQTREGLDDLGRTLDLWITEASRLSLSREKPKTQIEIEKLDQKRAEVQKLKTHLENSFDRFLASEESSLARREASATRSVTWVFAAALAAMFGSAAIFYRNYLYNLKTQLAREQEEHRARQLAGLGAILGQFMDPMETLRAVGQYCVEEVADWCLMNYMDQSRGFQRLAIVHHNLSKQPLCDRLAKFPISQSAEQILSDIIRNNHALLQQDVPIEEIENRAYSPEAGQIMLEIGIRSYVTAPLIAHGRVLGTIAFVRSKDNYTAEDLIFLEELARRTAISMENARLFKAAQQAIKAREDVVAIVSHDLRNPLSAVQLSTDLIRKCIAMSWNETVRSQVASRLDGITRSVDQASFLIQDILDVTKIDSDNLVIDKKMINAIPLMKQAVDVIKPLADQKRIQIDLRGPESECINADRGRILQVVSNLLGNSLKFTPPGGSISIRVTRSANDVVFSFRDTGPGIPKENLPHIFDRYYQAQSSHQQHGLGLGLSIARGIVMSHGGKIWVDSQLGLGTTFYFSIPAPPVTNLEPELNV